MHHKRLQKQTTTWNEECLADSEEVTTTLFMGNLPKEKEDEIEKAYIEFWEKVTHLVPQTTTKQDVSNIDFTQF